MKTANYRLKIGALLTAALVLGATLYGQTIKPTSALPPMSSPASGDLVKVVDVSDTTDSLNGSDKKITLSTLAAWVGTQIGASSGTVTSVGLTLPGGFSVASSPVTTSGTIAVTTSLSGLVKATGGNFVNATAGTDYLAPTGDGSGLTALTKGQVGLGAVENTALSTWAGSANVTTLGTIATGTWNATAIADAKIASAATWNAKQSALTFSTGLTNTGGTVTVNAINLAAAGSGGVTGILPKANGGTGTSSPALVAGTNVTITGTWPNQTINASGGGSYNPASVAITGGTINGTQIGATTRSYGEFLDVFATNSVQAATFVGDGSQLTNLNVKEPWTHISADFTAVAGHGYCVDTSSGPVTATLPGSPSDGDAIEFWDPTGGWQASNLTVSAANNIAPASTTTQVHNSNGAWRLRYVFIVDLGVWMLDAHATAY